MKFDQAIKEGFENYVSEDESQISIGRDVLESIRDLINDDDVVKIAVEKHRDKPELFKAINKLIFKVDSLLAPKKEEFPGKDEDEITIKAKESEYDLDDHVEKAADKANKAQRAGAFFGAGMGSKGKAAAAVKERDRLVGLAAKKYSDMNKQIKQQLTS